MTTLFQQESRPDKNRRYNTFPDEAPLLRGRDIYRGGLFKNPRTPSCRCLIGHAAVLCNVNPAFPPPGGAYKRLEKALKAEIRLRSGSNDIFDYNDSDASNREEIADVWNTVIVRDFDYIPE